VRLSGDAALPWKNPAPGTDAMKLPRVITEIQIRFSDIDVLGHVSNCVYMQYLELARVEFLEEVERLSPAGPQRPATVVVNCNIDMMREIRFHDRVRVETFCSRIGKTSFTLQQDIFANDIHTSSARFVCVGFDRKTRSSVALPAHWEPSEGAAAPE